MVMVNKGLMFPGDYRGRQCKQKRDHLLFMAVVSKGLIMIPKYRLCQAVSLSSRIISTFSDRERQVLGGQMSPKVYE